MFRYLKKRRKSNFIIIGISVIIYFGNVMFTTLDIADKRKDIADYDVSKFAGSGVCASCHKDIYESHIHTAHYLDSRPAAKEFIKGSFVHGGE
ncbi:MAG TPA: hypothetical protein VGP55_11700 [Chitinophagaceae bacterium]|nr:hypothetical protein [Chitinophagaceae bacterium]